MNGSSRKYTSGQSRDQSVFENGAMWVRLRVCSVSRQEWVVEEEWFLLNISSRWPPCNVWMYSFLLRNESSGLSLPALRPVKEAKRDKPRNANDYFMKIELWYKCAGLESKKTPALHVINANCQHTWYVLYV